MTRVVLLPEAGPVEGLGKAAAAMPLWGGSLAGATEAAVRVAGLRRAEEVPSGEEALVLEPPVALGRWALEAALAAGRAAGEDLALTVGGRSGAFLEEVRLGLPAGGLWYLAPGGTGSLRARLEDAGPHALAPDERSVDLGLPGAEPFPVTDRLVLPVRLWVHLLWANLLGLGPFLWAELVGRSVPGALLRLTWAALRARSLRPELVAARLTRRGPGARVHPGATVEASLLGEGARVGAGAVVWGSVLGPGAVVEELAVCKGAVLGAGAVVQRQGLAQYAVLGPGVRVGGCMQLAVAGPGASIKRGAYGMDQGLGGEVRVRVGEALVRAPLGLLGPCLGRDVRVGTGVWIAPGRVLPAGSVVLRDNALSDPGPPEDGPPEGPFVVRGGRLERP